MTYSSSPSPAIKFEDSPAESFLSAPGDMFTSLFDATTPPSTMQPLEMMTPISIHEPEMIGNIVSTPSAPHTPAPEAAAPSTQEKKPAKKRKSWGQVLPEPKTNLPPRKRAKTEDEKEQRRVERVLRNRRAAQSSRERKRLEVEALENKNKELEVMLARSQDEIEFLRNQVRRCRCGSGVIARSSSPLDAYHDSVTLSKQLFSSQDRHEPNPGSAATIMDAILIQGTTVNPASISPALGPVADSAGPLAELPPKDAKVSEQTPAPSPNVTQCSAVSHVGGEAQVVTNLATLADQNYIDLASQLPADYFSLDNSRSLPAAIGIDHAVLDSNLLASPHSSNFGDDPLVGDYSPSFTDATSDFELSDYVHAGDYVTSDSMGASDNAAADFGTAFTMFDSEIQNFSENSNQQPQPVRVQF